ncbi:MAG TPA: glycosyltransferase [Candidatus Sumerlaeia bacterium]|nr:glycosyltransferase [Candidatus Sumerlaeia bacterium]HRS00268.1 glycosyltransferase [Candidatus Sumerlaeia bacterium]
MVKVLHITYRFGGDIIGGAENYLWNLSRQLASRGVDVTIAATTARDFHLPTRWNVFYKEGYKAGEEVSDGLRILRFPFFATPKWLAGFYGRSLQRQFDAEEWTYPPPPVQSESGGILLRGWYFEEPAGRQSIRWTQKTAEILIRGEHIWEIGFSALCPWKNSGEVFINGEKAGEFLPNSKFQYFAFKPLSPQNELFIQIRLKKTKRPWRDLRSLGMMVGSIAYKQGDDSVDLPLHQHYSSYLYPRKNELFGWLETRAKARPVPYNALFDKARGPVSKPLMKYIYDRAGEYDLILGHDFPNWTLGAAIMAGKRAGIATAALPLAHLEDDYYHWRHYYEALAAADLTFSLSDYSRDVFRARWGANAHTLGGGINLDEFQTAQFHGGAFRKKHGLENIPMVLFIGRKSYPKRYDSLIRAMRIVNQSRPARLVMIGPDENRQPIEPADALYLGSENRQGILDALDACDIFAMLSGSESFGMVFTEAWMRRKPVIGYRYCGAVASLITDGEDGYLCDSDEDVARRILELLDHPDLRQRMGAAGEQKTLARYTWDIIGAKALAHYQEAIAQKSQ